jgi:uncharacterized protein
LPTAAEPDLDGLCEAFLLTRGEGDAAHDLDHVRRVVVAAADLCAPEGANERLVRAAAWLHDCVHVAKDSPDRSRASRMCANEAGRFLRGLGWTESDVLAVEHAVEAHSFTAGIEPRTPEARVVQDADRLDALGAHGLARNLMLAGSWNGRLAHPTDPWARRRPLDDRAWAVDHHFAKLLRLPGTMKTAAGRREAVRRADFLKLFLRELARERGIDPPEEALG